jgi:ribosomal protein S18 acetylase RimI-like enzyme
MEISVRRIAAGEGALLRDVRLRALHDSPTAFASTLAAEAVENDSHWADRALSGSAGHDTATFVAVRADGVVGLVVGYHPDPSRRAIELVSMWTAPSARRHGVARGLVDTLVSWADEAAADAVELWVTEGNAAAMTLYRAAGFELTGERGSLPSDPSLNELRMKKQLR